MLGSDVIPRQFVRRLALEYQLRQIEASKKFPDQLVSDPNYWAIKDALADLDKEMN